MMSVYVHATFFSAVSAAIFFASNVVAILAYCDGVYAAEIPLVLSEDSVSSSDCGVFAMTAALRSIGHPVDVKLFLTEEFVPDFLGSRPKDLCKLGAIYGVDCRYVESLSFSDIKASNSPILLFLRERGTHSTLGDWVAFLGMNQNSLVIFDSGRTSKPNVYEVSPADLLVNWQGQAIVVGGEKPTFFRVRANVFETLLPICLVALTVSVFPFFHRGNSALRILSATFFICIFFGKWSILHDRECRIVEFLSAKYSAEVFPELTLHKARVKYDDIPVRLVDARHTQDFVPRHLSGSTNIPVNASIQEIENIVNEWDLQDILVVYCYSRNCSIGDVIARRLRALGFSNIIVSRESIEELFNAYD
jgi:rhodanese-related sulfurtransferase